MITHHVLQEGLHSLVLWASRVQSICFGNYKPLAIICVWPIPLIFVVHYHFHPSTALPASSKAPSVGIPAWDGALKELEACKGVSDSSLTQALAIVVEKPDELFAENSEELDQALGHTKQTNVYKRLLFNFESFRVCHWQAVGYHWSHTVTTRCGPYDPA